MYILAQAARRWWNAAGGNARTPPPMSTEGETRSRKRRRVLGKGVYGCVIDGKECGAVKIVEEDKNDKLQGLFFDREVESMRRVSHKNVIRMLGWGKSDYMSMGMDEGMKSVYGFIRMEKGGYNVHEWLRDKKLQETLSTKTKMRMIEGLISGLVAIHSAGVVHRDIKPANIVLCDGQMKFCDFGLAQLDGMRARRGSRRVVREVGSYAVVTYLYRAPELEVFQESGTKGSTLR